MCCWRTRPRMARRSWSQYAHDGTKHGLEPDQVSWTRILGRLVRFGEEFRCHVHTRWSFGSATDRRLDQQADHAGGCTLNSTTECLIRLDRLRKRWIDAQLAGTSVAVVLVGADTASRPWVKYEIAKSIELCKGLLAIDISKIKDHSGQTVPTGKNPLASGYKWYQ